MKKLNKTRFAKRALEDFSRTMIELLSKKPFENIMVSEICEISNYPRATFYNYFEDKYDLLNYCWDCFGEKIDFQNDYDYMDTDEKMYDLFNSLYDFFKRKYFIKGRRKNILKVFIRRRNIMIFYFSATGNSKYVAEKISGQTGEKIISIVDCLKNNNFDFEVDKDVLNFQ